MLTALGYYGFNNLGDDLLLASLNTALQQVGQTRWQILSQNPEQASQIYPQATCFHRMRPWSVIRALVRSQWLILGGGGLFQDTTSLKNVVYYAAMVLLARLLGNRVLWWAQGIGPLNHPLSRALTGLALRLSHTITVRDETSEQWVRQLAPGTRFSRVADPVWLLHPSAKVASSTSTDVGISLRAWPSLTPEAIKILAHVVHQSFPPDHCLVLIPFQPQQDDAPLQQFQANLPANRQVRWAEDAHLAFSSLSSMVGMRFHAVVLALLNQVPVYALAYDPKVSHLCQSLNLPYSEIQHINTIKVIQPTMAANSSLEAIQAQAVENLTALKVIVDPVGQS